MPDFIEGDLRIAGSLIVQGSLLPKRPRTDLEQESNAVYVIDLFDLRVWDAVQTTLPGTAANDDLGISGGTWATHSVYVNAGDLKAAGATTRRARFTFALPPEYVAGESVTIRASAGMITTQADTSCTIDFEAYVNGADSTIDGSDLVTTSATSMNSTTFANKDFAVTSSGLSPGNQLDVRMTIICTDGATGTAVIPAVGLLSVLLDIRG